MSKVARVGKREELDFAEEARTPASSIVSFHVLLRCNEQETARWREWLSKQTEAVLQIPAGNPSKEMGTIRDLLFHILIVEWVYEKVLGGKTWENNGRNSTATPSRASSRSRRKHSRSCVHLPNQRVMLNWHSSTRSRLAADRPLPGAGANFSPT